MPREFYAASGAAPPGAGSGSGWESSGGDQPWSLFLSSGARRLVVVFFVLGAVAWISYQIALPAFFRGDLTRIEASIAQQETTTAYNTLESQAQAFGASSARCGAATELGWRGEEC